MKFRAGKKIKGETACCSHLPVNAIKAAHRYAVQGSDTTMMTIAASLFRQ
ncbi:MAG: hypothetical protein H7211_00170 [Aquabacterium sp.]|nr:hypothetical protein [Ferruginibacter sp.]